MELMTSIDFVEYFQEKIKNEQSVFISIKHGEILIQELIEKTLESEPKLDIHCWWQVPSLRSRCIFTELWSHSVSELAKNGANEKAALISAIQIVYNSIIEPVNEFLKKGGVE
jgi:hypothetical protein